MFADPANHPYLTAGDGRHTFVHKARIRKPVAVIPLGRTPSPRYAAPGSNHHMEIYAVLDKEGAEKTWKSEIVSLYDAAQKGAHKRPVINRDHGPNTQFKFSLAGGEYIEMDDESKGRSLYRVTVISGNQVEFRLHADARPITILKKIRGRAYAVAPAHFSRPKHGRWSSTRWEISFRPMINRILDFSEAPARLRVRYAQLIVQRQDLPEVSVPLADLAVILVAHPQVTFTQAVLSGLAEAGGVFISCDGRNLPVGMMLPLGSHHAQAERFAAQACAPLPVRKRLWRQIVRAKIQAQAALLVNCAVRILASGRWLAACNRATRATSRPAPPAATGPTCSATSISAGTAKTRTKTCC